MALFTLHPLQSADIPHCISIYFHSFQNPHSLACWPRTPSVRAWWEQMLSDELHEAGSHWLKAVSATGDIAGFAKWQEPKHGVVPSTELPEWPDEADGKLCDETFGMWARRHGELMVGRGHWYLEIVATDPAFKGKGAGSQMIRWGTEQADREGTEAFLEASPDAVALYERHGFREVGYADTFVDNERVRRTWYRNLFMIRPPRGEKLQ